MTTTVTRLFEDFADAEKAVLELERMGIPEWDISLMSSNEGNVHSHRVKDGTPPATKDPLGEDVGIGAGAGALAGGAGGLLAGLGLLTIPGFGPVVAAGWLAATAAGAVGGAMFGGSVGGVVGSLAEAGMSEEDAHICTEGLRRGDTLVSVKAPDELVTPAEAALDDLGGVPAGLRGGQYREEGWSPRFGSFDDVQAKEDRSSPPVT